MARQGKGPNRKNVTLCIETKLHEHLKRLSFSMSAKENRKIGMSELMRAALEQCYPLPGTQIEMDFSSKEIVEAGNE